MAWNRRSFALGARSSGDAVDGESVPQALGGLLEN